jgi:hypothetical protein
MAMDMEIKQAAKTELSLVGRSKTSCVWNKDNEQNKVEHQKDGQTDFEMTGKRLGTKDNLQALQTLTWGNGRVNNGGVVKTSGAGTTIGDGEKIGGPMPQRAKISQIRRPGQVGRTTACGKDPFNVGISLRMFRRIDGRRGSSRPWIGIFKLASST